MCFLALTSAPSEFPYPRFNIYGLAIQSNNGMAYK
jgi:hypothetical protein